MKNKGFVIRRHVKITSRKKRGPRKTRTVYVWLKTKCQGGVDFAMGKDVSDVRFCYEGVTPTGFTAGGLRDLLSHSDDDRRVLTVSDEVLPMPTYETKNFYDYITAFQDAVEKKCTRRAKSRTTNP
jgi:hypothetical protein